VSEVHRISAASIVRAFARSEEKPERKKRQRAPVGAFHRGPLIVDDRPKAPPIVSPPKRPGVVLSAASRAEVDRIMESWPKKAL
jgi:hypothetical protein